jgi:phosphoserine phosphatase RsbU/P
VERIDAAALIGTETELAEITRVVKRLEDAIAIFAHDLRSPLAAIIAGAALLQKARSIEDTQFIIMNMTDCATRASSLVDDLTNATTAPRGHLRAIAETDRDIKRLLTQIIQEHCTTNPERVVQANIQLANSPPVDRSRFGQMFANLLGNAFMHGAADKPIFVDAFTADSFLEVRVRNGGKAISSEKMKTLFDPYKGSDNPANRGGRGLGLYIVAEMARAHGGDVCVTSNEMETCFRVSIPMGPPNAG